MFKLQNILKWGLPILVVCACQFSSNDGTELPNELTGTLYLPGGAPANNAQVTLYPANHVPGNNSASTAIITRTNSSGQFSFSKIANGQYNVSARIGTTIGTKVAMFSKTSSLHGAASSDNLFWFADSVTLSGTGFKLLPDTLRTPGSVTGSIQMQPGDDPRSAFLLVLGTDIFIAPDTGGHFTLLDMARGNYTVRILTTSDKYLPLDVSFSVRSGAHDTLTSSIVLPFKGIPTVAGLKIKYDTLLQIATLSWNRADTALVSGYNIYRKRSDSNYVKLNPLTLKDTQYVDSLMLQDYTYQFNIRSVDKNGNEGAFQNGVAQKAVSAYQLIDSINVGTAAQDLRYNGKNLMAIISDFYQANGPKLAVIDTAGTSLGIFYADNLTALRGIDRTGRVWANVQVKDPLYSILTGAVRSYSTGGTVLKTLFDANQPYSYTLNALAVKNNNAYVSFKYNGSNALMDLYDDTTTSFPRNFPNSASPLTFPSTLTTFFDNGSDNNRLTFLQTSSILSYDTLGNLKAQYPVLSGIQSVSSVASENGYVVHHCSVQGSCYFDVVDKTFKRVAIFQGRLNLTERVSTGSSPPTFYFRSWSGFIDAYNRLFVMEQGGPIRIYAPRRKVL